MAMSEELEKDILGVNPDDPRLTIFADRVARACRRADLGMILPGRPLASFLLVGESYEAPVTRLVEALSCHFIGPAHSAMPFSYTRIDGASYGTPYHGMMNSLVGPLSPDPAGHQPLPRLAQINFPHFFIRCREKLSKLEQWNRQFRKTYRDHINRKSAEDRSQFLMELDQKILDMRWELHCQEEERSAFRSVVFFNGVDRGVPDFQNLVYEILSTGSHEVFAPGTMSFSSSIIICSTYLERSFFKSGEICLLEAGGEKDALRAEYLNVKTHLRSNTSLGPIIDAVGDNIILVRDATSHAGWRTRVEGVLKELESRYGRLGLTLSFEDEFISGLIKDIVEERKERKERAGDKPKEVYTEGRLRNALTRHVDDEIAKLLDKGILSAGSHLVFKAGRRPAGFAAKVEIKPSKNANPYTADEVYAAFFRSDEASSVSLEELEHDEFLRPLHEWAVDKL